MTPEIGPESADEASPTPRKQSKGERIATYEEFLKDGERALGITLDEEDRKKWTTFFVDVWDQLTADDRHKIATIVAETTKAALKFVV